MLILHMRKLKLRDSKELNFTELRFEPRSFWCQSLYRTPEPVTERAWHTGTALPVFVKWVNRRNKWNSCVRMRKLTSCNVDYTSVVEGVEFKWRKWLFSYWITDIYWELTTDKFIIWVSHTWFYSLHDSWSSKLEPATNKGLWGRKYLPVLMSIFFSISSKTSTERSFREIISGGRSGLQRA